MPGHREQQVPSSEQPIVSMQRVSYTFGTHWALKNIDFSLNKGDFLFLTGPSGAGKTSLLRLLYASLPLARGAASVAGFTLGKLRRRDVALLRRQVSVVFQDFRILPDRTVAANIALPLEVRGTPAVRVAKRVRAVLRSLGMENKADARCDELSGGEKQRVAIGRAIVVSPQVLLADEPTGNLDQELAMHLMRVFKQFNTFGTTVILATHNRDLMASCDQAKRLDLLDGRIVGANWEYDDRAFSFEQSLRQTGNRQVTGPGQGAGIHYEAERKTDQQPEGLIQDKQL